MVHLDAIRAANSELANSRSLVAVFVGATSGIGEYTLRELVRMQSQQGKGLHIYLVGRNAKSANHIIEDCKATRPDAQYHFIQAKDLSLIQNIDKAVADIIEHQQQNPADGSSPRVDMLFMSQGGLYLEGRQETDEGIDFGMAMHYYSRARFTYQLLPLLKASHLPAAHIVSVMAAGMEDKLVTDDLSLREPSNFSFGNVRSHCCFMTTTFFERLAAENPGRLSLVNMFPGLVITPAFYNDYYPLWFKVVWRLFSPLAWLMSTPAEEAGQRVLFLATERFPAKNSDVSPKDTIGVAMGTDGQLGSGAYACDKAGEPTSQAKRDKANQGLQYPYEQVSQMVWEHTMKAFDTIAGGERFEH